MKRTNKIIVTLVLVVALLIGIGYAAIQNITLNIEGKAEAEISQDNFKVAFAGEPTVSDEEFVIATVTDDINATINVEGLTEKGQTVSAIYTVQNTSTDISADLAVSTTNDNPEYFTLSSKLDKTSLVAGESTTLTVTVELTKVPVIESVSSIIGVQLTAIPVEPGKEGTSEEINDFSQTPNTLAIVTNDNIGDYIDLGNSIIGTESTTDDWRILYKEDDKVYAILADYLPANQISESAGLDTDTTNKPYNVWSNTNRNTLLNGLLNETAWSNLASGISGAKVIGSPTVELLMSSYNTKNETELVYTDYPKLDSTTTDYDLYVPHISNYENCLGYWLASPYEESSDYLWLVFSSIGVDVRNYAITSIGVRPVITLPTNLVVELVDGVWKVLN